ncbi:MAG: hypothetical protein QXM31_01850 [Candidatus Woesearchaeota archaeon]
MDDRLKVLYIERDPMSWKSSEVQKAYAKTLYAVREALSRRFDVRCEMNLLQVPDEKILSGGFNILLTHLQEDPGDDAFFKYGKSIEKLKGLKEKKPDLRIIVYTGAIQDFLYPIQSEKWASAIVRKRPAWELKDSIEELNKSIDDVVAEIRGRKA